MVKIKNFSWNRAGTNIIINEVTWDESKDIMDLFNIKDESQFQDGNIYIYGKDITDTFLFEENFIDNKKNNLLDVLDKLNEKTYTSPFYYYSQSKGELININEFYKFEDMNFFKTVLANNIVNSLSYNSNNFCLSPKIFETIMYMLHKYDNIDNKTLYLNILTYLRELFTLMAISERTDIKKDKNNGISFEFTLFNDLHGNIKQSIKWTDWSTLSKTQFYSLYEWITDELEDGVENNQYDYNFKQGKLRLSLVRSYLKEKKEFKSSKNTINELSSILNRVRKNETEEYFSQQNKLKDEMIQLAKDEINSKRSITNRVIGLITTVAVGIFTQFYDLSITNWSELLSSNFSISLIFFFSFIAIIFFLFSFYLDIKERIAYYNKLKKIYVNDLNFDSNDFKDKIQQPKLWRDYKVYWWILIICATLSLFGMIYFSFIANSK